MLRDKFALTRELLKHLKDDKTITFEQARSLWWYNIQQSGGLRLTTFGYQTLVNDIELAHYRYELKETDIFDARTIILLDQRLLMPYYIVGKKGIATDIVFFGSKEATMIRLYDDLANFLANYVE